MKFMDAVRKRKSYRGEFLNTPVPREDLLEILEAGYMAPSGCNLQTTLFIGVDEPDLLEKLADICQIGWVKTAPAAILVLTQKRLSPSGISYHVQDYSAATENICLAAADKGYGTVWIEGQIYGDRAGQMGKLLGVPDEIAVAVYLPLGVPAADTSPREKKPFEDRVWLNGYRSRRDEVTRRP